MTELGVFAVALALYAIFSRRVEASIVTAPIIFVTVGLVLSLDPIDLVSLQFRNSEVLLVGEITLVLVLFSDAMRVQVSELGSRGKLPLRLLTTGLVLTIVAGAAVAAVTFTSLSFWEAAVLAAILAPTDAGLGQAVISDRRVPLRIRHALNVESGLNDGIVTPIFLIFVSIIVAEEEAGSPASWLRHITEDLAAGVLAGVAVGFIGAWLIRWSIERDWMTPVYQRLVFPAVAIASWQIAVQIHGNGFVAAFVAGIVTAWVIQGRDEPAVEYIEASSELLVLAVFFVFGAVATDVIGGLSMRVWLYALLSLTLVRMLPVAIALLGTRLQSASVLFIGWFGPRGLASIVLLLLLLNDHPEVAGSQTITEVVTLTVLISVVAHGLSVNPLIAAYSRRLARAPADAREFGDAVAIAPRLGSIPPVAGSTEDLAISDDAVMK